MRARLCVSSQEALLLVPRLPVVCDCDPCAFGARSAPHRCHTVLSPAAYILSPDEYFGCSLVSSLSLGVMGIRWRWGHGDTCARRAHTHAGTHTPMRKGIYALFTRRHCSFSSLFLFLLNLTVTLIFKKPDLWNEFKVKWRVFFFFLKSLFNIW